MLFRALLAFAVAVAHTDAHSYLHVVNRADGTACSWPRGSKATWGMCGSGHGCKGPCESLKAEAPFLSKYYQQCELQRGEEVQVCWKRNNHPGGFVQLSFAPFEQSDTWEPFKRNIVKFSCYEVGCGPSDPNDDLFGPLTGVDNGQSTCCTNVRIPNNVDGPTTMQWTWFGGGVVYAQSECGFGEYMGCTDFLVKGGEPYQPSALVRPTFEGGDVYVPRSNQCRYWTSNKQGDCMFRDRYPALGQETLEPCVGARGTCTGYKVGVPYEIERGLAYAIDAWQPDVTSYMDGDDAAPNTEEPPASADQPTTVAPVENAYQRNASSVEAAISPANVVRSVLDVGMPRENCRLARRKKRVPSPDVTL